MFDRWFKLSTRHVLDMVVRYCTANQHAQHTPCCKAVLPAVAGVEAWRRFASGQCGGLYRHMYMWLRRWLRWAMCC
jgi:hypothetical protein